jgi:hypothetical protein
MNRWRWSLWRLCGFCHRLEPTSTAARRCPDPKTMPNGKWDGTEEEVKQYKAKWNANIVHWKHEHVDARKLAVGACRRCERAVTPANVWAFDWDHRDSATKLMGGLAGKRGGVSGLVVNNAVAACIVRTPAFKDVLDAEMDKCDLLCRNCHKRKTHNDDDSDESDDEA